MIRVVRNVPGDKSVQEVLPIDTTHESLEKIQRSQMMMPREDTDVSLSPTFQPDKLKELNEIMPR